jgi:hypothetical protein
LVARVGEEFAHQEVTRGNVGMLGTVLGALEVDLGEGEGY